eukprot:CAMPEP_0115843054 /NCGR_PEP_ID=MMETSP0287-20121206/8117_1 /TAXON_ID=412157 /ORGANISM="Chrysochromulina rotalis, Strain UIO044" /LENGTH=354 /DNA_ID=CAMNT_0003296741 /DNA_START=25 /DNA_END=1089 /DNA_ORIENTATION=-
MPPYSGFTPLVGGGAQRAAPPARPVAPTRTGLQPTAGAASSQSDPLHERSAAPALRSTFVDKEEAAMLRAMARLNGDDPAKRAGNSFSKTNRVRIQAQAEEAAAMGLVPLDPKDQHELARKMEAGYTTISQRAINVPKVGQRAPRERPAAIDLIPRRRGEEEIRQANDNFERPSAPLGRPTKSSDEKKDDLALRNQFNGRTPAEIVAETRSRAPPKPPQPAPPSSLRQQIEDEVMERQEFLDNSEHAMNQLNTPLEYRLRRERCSCALSCLLTLLICSPLLRHSARSASARAWCRARGNDRWRDRREDAGSQGARPLRGRRGCLVVKRVRPMLFIGGADAVAGTMSEGGVGPKR